MSIEYALEKLMQAVDILATGSGRVQERLDLTPLVGMPIQSLRITKTLVTDLSPLRGMPLRFLSLTGTSANAGSA